MEAVPRSRMQQQYGIKGPVLQDMLINIQVIPSSRGTRNTRGANHIGHGKGFWWMWFSYCDYVPFLIWIQQPINQVITSDLLHRVLYSLFQVTQN